MTIKNLIERRDPHPPPTLDPEETKKGKRRRGEGGMCKKVLYVFVTRRERSGYFKLSPCERC